MINKEQLGNTLWGIADILREKVEDQNAYILILMSFKRLSDNYTWEIKNSIGENENIGKLNKKHFDIIKAKAHVSLISDGSFWKDVFKYQKLKHLKKMNHPKKTKLRLLLVYPNYKEVSKYIKRFGEGLTIKINFRNLIVI